MSALVTAEGVVWRNRSGFALGPADIAIHNGEVVALIGANGAGKSTLARLLAGIWRADQGSVRWSSLGTKPPPRHLARGVSYLQQSLPGGIGLSVEEVVELGRFVHRHDDRPAAAGEYCRQALAQVGLDGYARRSIDRLSGGERKRALLAAVLAQRAPFLILDEPTAHLDPASHRLVAEAIRGFVSEDPESRAALVATHDLHFARTVAHRVLGLSNGRLEDLGDRTQAFAIERLAELFGTAFAPASEGPPVVDLRGADR